MFYYFAKNFRSSCLLVLFVMKWVFSLLRPFFSKYENDWPFSSIDESKLIMHAWHPDRIVHIKTKTNKFLFTGNLILGRKYLLDLFVFMCDLCTHGYMHLWNICIFFVFKLVQMYFVEFLSNFFLLKCFITFFFKFQNQDA